MIEDLTPQKIVEELNKFIVGQEAAKKAVAIALRNRWRRKNVDDSLRDEIMPKNILMVGPTGVGKTEIARRLSKLARAPFLKVEATKFTEVGYVGRDVESIIRDIIEVAIKIEKERQQANVKEKAKMNAVDRILDILVGPAASPDTKEKFKKKILSGDLDNNEIEIEISEPKTQAAPIDLAGGASMGVINLSDMIGKALNGGKKKQKKLNVKDALDAIVNEECDKMSDEDTIIKNSIYAVENEGIVFIDEIDKIVVRNGEIGRAHV